MPLKRRAGSSPVIRTKGEVPHSQRLCSLHWTGTPVYGEGPRECSPDLRYGRDVIVNVEVHRSVTSFGLSYLYTKVQMRSGDGDLLDHAITWENRSPNPRGPLEMKVIFDISPM